MADDAAIYKELIGDIFGRAAPTYGGYGPPFVAMGKRLVEAAKIQPGWKVLDVAAGRGAVSRPLAAAVGDSGQVQAIDLSPPMVAATTAELANLGITNVSMRQMDAEHLELADAGFDAVLCGFGLMFLPHLPVALAEFRRVLGPGGTLGVTTWGESDPSWSWCMTTARDYLALEGSVAPRTRQQLDKQADLAQVLEDAGFADVVVTTETLEGVYPDEEAWWGSLWSHGMRIWLERMSPALLVKFKADVFSRVRPQRESDGFHQRWQGLIAIARRG